MYLQGKVDRSIKPVVVKSFSNIADAIEGDFEKYVRYASIYVSIYIYIYESIYLILYVSMNLCIYFSMYLSI
jgi:hypothetical protein